MKPASQLGPDLSPQALMRPDEFLTAQRLLLKRERMQNKWVAADYGRTFSPRDAMRYSKQREEIGSAIDALSAAVIERELAIERYMVLHYLRDDGRETRLQVLRFDIHRRNFAAGWTWEFDGRALRKD